MKCPHCNKEIEKRDTIIIDGVEYETKLHTEMNRISLIKIPEGWRLMTITEFFNIFNNHRDKFDMEQLDEVIENPSVKAREKYPYWNMWLAGLDSNSNVYGLNWYLNYDSALRGVRFCRDVKKRSKK